MNIAKYITGAFGLAWLVMVGMLGQDLQAWNYDLGLWVKFVALLVPLLIAGFWIIKATDK